MAEIYILDANVFIQAARMHYAFDLVPTFWQALIVQASQGRVRSIDRVRDEILRGNDELAEWVKSQFNDSFLSTDDDDIFTSYREIIAWAEHQTQFTPAAKAEFARVADGWLVACARARGGVVVTHEKFQAGTRNRVLIPNVCRAFGVPAIDTFAMMRTLGVRL